MDIFVVVLFVDALLVLIALLGFVRIDQVFHYRKKVINYVYSQENLGELRDIFDSVSPSEMLWKFWRKPSSFFPKEISDHIN